MRAEESMLGRARLGQSRTGWRALLVTLLPTLAAAQQPPLGSEPVSVKEAVAHFRAACLDTAPGFEGAAEALRAAGLAPNPETGTFYHPTLALSIQADDACTMVMESREPAEALVEALAAAATAVDGTAATIARSPHAGAGEVEAVGPGGTTFALERLGGGDGAATWRAGLWPRT